MKRTARSVKTVLWTLIAPLALVGGVAYAMTSTPQPDYSTSVSPLSQATTQGNLATYDVMLTSSYSFSGTVSLSVSGLPKGATASFTPSSVSVTPSMAGASKLNVQTSSTTPTGNYGLSITATSGKLSHSTSVLLIVNTSGPDFGIAPSPSTGTTQTVSPSAAASYAMTLTSSGGFAGNVSLSVSGLPTGATASVNPNPAPVTSSGGSSTLSVYTSAKTPTGTYGLLITATSGKLTHYTAVTLVVQPTTAPNFTMDASPSSLSASAGTSATSTVTLSPSNGFTGSVKLSAQGLPGGASASFSPNPTSVSSAPAASTITITTTLSTPVGSYSVLILGSGGGLTRYAAISLSVTQAQAGLNFTITGDAPSSLYPGAPAQSIPVKLTNPNTVAIYVTNLTTSLQSPSSSCDASSNFTVTQSNISSTQPVTVPAGGSVTLSGLAAPRIQMVDTNTNQNGCRSVRLSLSYSGSAHS